MGTINAVLNSIGDHNWAVLLVLLAAALFAGVVLVNVRVG